MPLERESYDEEREEIYYSMALGEEGASTDEECGEDSDVYEEYGEKSAYMYVQPIEDTHSIEGAFKVMAVSVCIACLIIFSLQNF